MTKPPTRPKRAPQTQRQHRGVALAFGISTLAFAIVTAYFALASTTITITTKSQPVTVVFPLTVQAAAPTADQTDVLQGAFATTTEAAQATADALKSTQTVDAKATGTVTLTNTWSQAQPLAATTRLLSSSGVLFRLDAFVSVPAHGTADVKVTADAAGATGDIGPTHFTIPGLSTELQAKIYGDSAAAMTGGTIAQAAVTADDIEALRKTLADKLTVQAQQTLTQKLTEQNKAASDTIRFFAKPTTETFSAAVGDPVTTLTGSATAAVVGVALNTDDLYGAIVAKLLAQLPEGETIIGFSENNFTMALDTYDQEKQTLTLNVTANGMSTADLTHASFAKSKLTNKSRAEIVSYLSGLNIVDTVTVAFRPFWVTRTPVLTDHINLVVTNP